MPPGHTVHLPISMSTKAPKADYLSSITSANPCVITGTHDPSTGILTLSIANPTEDDQVYFPGDLIGECTLAAPDELASLGCTGPLSLVEYHLKQDQTLSEQEIMKQVHLFTSEGRANTSATYAIAHSPKLQLLDENRPYHLTQHQIEHGVPVAHLDRHKAKKVRAMLPRIAQAFATSELDFKQCPHFEASIELLPRIETVNAKYKAVSQNLRKATNAIVDKYLASGLLQLCDTPCEFTSSMLFHTEPDGTVSAYMDMRLLNINSTKLQSPLISHQAITASLMNAKFISSFELDNPHLAIKLSEATRHLSCFHDERKKKLCFTCLPPAWTNAPKFVHDLISQALGLMKNVHWVTHRVYVVTTTESFDQHLEILEIAINKAILSCLKIKHESLYVCQNFIELHGVMFAHGRARVPEVRIQGVLDFPEPRTGADLLVMLSSMKKYSKFIPRYAEVVAPLTAFAESPDLKVPPEKYLKWTQEHSDNLIAWKQAIMDAVELHVPDPSRPYICHSDASQHCLAFTVDQQTQEGDTYPVAFLSRLLTAQERTLSTFRKEALGLLLGLTCFDWLLFGASLIRMLSDAKGLSFLRATKTGNSELAKVAALMSSYPIEVYHLSGSSNVTADIFSRFHSGNKALLKEIATKFRPMPEAEAILLLNKMNIPPNTKFSVAEVKMILEGDSFPSMVQKKQTAAKQAVAIFNQRRGLPQLKACKRAPLPFACKPHPFYRNSFVDSALRARNRPEGQAIDIDFRRIEEQEINRLGHKPEWLMTEWQHREYLHGMAERHPEWDTCRQPPEACTCHINTPEDLLQELSSIWFHGEDFPSKVVPETIQDSSQSGEGTPDEASPDTRRRIFTQRRPPGLLQTVVAEVHQHQSPVQSPGAVEPPSSSSPPLQASSPALHQSEPMPLSPPREPAPFREQSIQEDLESEALHTVTPIVTQTSPPPQTTLTVPDTRPQTISLPLTEAALAADYLTKRALLDRGLDFEGHPTSKTTRSLLWEALHRQHPNQHGCTNPFVQGNSIPPQPRWW